MSIAVLKINLENCYGIKKLNTEFQFDDTHRTYAIYAPNGVMKTSLAKTITDYLGSKKESKDQVFDKEPYVRLIRDENDAEFDRAKIFVIGSFVDTEYSSDRISTLLVRGELREQYDKALDELVNQKKPIISKLASKDSSNSSDCESEIVRTFSVRKSNFFEIIQNILNDIELEGGNEPFVKYQFKYNDIFDNKSVDSFLAKNKDNLKTYYETYYEVLKKSDGFFAEDGSFGTLQAANVSKSVSDDAFFKAGHKFILNKHDQTIESAKDFQFVIDDAKSKVLSNPEVKKQFDKIDSALAPNTLSGLRKIIQKNKEILLELVDMEGFRRKYWISHLYQALDDLKELNNLYQEKRPLIESIVEQANEESQKWKNVIRIFSSRFIELPFKVALKNKNDAVLGLEQPELVFIFVDRDTSEEKEVPRNFLTNNVLSNGEKRAFYLLNIIFEIQCRLEEGEETLFVIDDIADSFDYKNKYAIVEYLHDISLESDRFSSIILTHNFDFYRTISLRLKIKEDKRLFAQKESDHVDLIPESTVCPMDPFKEWKKTLTDAQVIALIPFTRNLIEYGRFDGKRFLKLTALLHKKKETKYRSDGKAYKTTEVTEYDEGNGDFTIAESKDILFSHIEDTITDYLGIRGFPSNVDLSVSIVSRVLAVADSMDNNPALENKIVLAIAIRYMAEDYMISKINNDNWLMKITNSQTSELLKKFKGKIKSGDIPIEDIDDEVIELLERVNITTPENIHINSFMYEPIVDMGIGELKALYDSVKAKLH